jgi:hypothetical protein
MLLPITKNLVDGVMSPQAALGEVQLGSLKTMRRLFTNKPDLDFKPVPLASQQGCA